MKVIVRKLLIITLIVLTKQLCPGQTIEDEVLELLISEIRNSDTEVENIESIINQYESFLNEPININEVNKTKLEQLIFINPDDINEILNYHKRYGDFLSSQELNAIQNVSKRKIKLLQYLTTTSSKSKNINRKRYLKQRLIYKSKYVVEKKQGFSDGTYVGDRIYHLIKYRGVFDKIEFGLTLEKDAGETWNSLEIKNPTSFDFGAFYLDLKLDKTLDRVVLGQYKFSTGQGLVLGNSFGGYKTSNSIGNVISNSTGLNPSRSSSEYGYFRGVATKVNIGNFSISPFISFTSEDASLDSETNRISSLIKTGLHRNQSEITNKNRLERKLVGINLDFRNKKQTLKVGFNHISTLFNYPIPYFQNNHTKEKEYLSKHSISSIYSNYDFRDFHAFGELALDNNKHYGLIMGFLKKISVATKLVAKLRIFEEQFYSPFGNTIRESKNSYAEKGIYIGIKTSINSNLTIEAFLDRYNFPSGDKEILSSYGGNDFLIASNYTITNDLDLRVAYRQKSKQISPEKIKRRLDFSYHYRTKKWLELKGKLTFQNTRLRVFEKLGHSIIQDIIFRFEKGSIKSRFAIFEVENFENRIYNYEPDLLYSFSFPFFYKKGIRLSLLLSYKFSKNLKLQFKLARSNYPLERNISSGAEKIDKNHKTDLSFQCIYSF